MLPECRKIINAALEASNFPPINHVFVTDVLAVIQDNNARYNRGEIQRLSRENNHKVIRELTGYRAPYLRIDSYRIVDGEKEQIAISDKLQAVFEAVFDIDLTPLNLGMEYQVVISQTGQEKSAVANIMKFKTQPRTLPAETIAVSKGLAEKLGINLDPADIVVSSIEAILPKNPENDNAFKNEEINLDNL